MSLPIGTKIPLFAEGNATENDVLEGKTFSTEKGNGLKGTIKNNGSITIEPTLEDKKLEQGFFSNIQIKGLNNLSNENLNKFIKNLQVEKPSLIGKKYTKGTGSFVFTEKNLLSQNFQISLNFKPSLIIVCFNNLYEFDKSNNKIMGSVVLSSDETLNKNCVSIHEMNCNINKFIEVGGGKDMNGKLTYDWSLINGFKLLCYRNKSNKTYNNETINFYWVAIE